ncbi:hypothetical protein CEXT_287121 [Caerostris extrusa]|uniref:Uncharacterized protein n=1 Tax=Caerostris extrusa TaxID=172846 RepID=A0AAV4VCU6_CAEEX|nr:hypothetical protein CEXT_287121 [Caerostris extrusa]
MFLLPTHIVDHNKTTKEKRYQKVLSQAKEEGTNKFYSIGQDSVVFLTIDFFPLKKKAVFGFAPFRLENSESLLFFFFFFEKPDSFATEFPVKILSP